MIGHPKKNREEDVTTKHKEEYSKIWKRKQKKEDREETSCIKEQKEECEFSLNAQHKGNQWMFKAYEWGSEQFSQLKERKERKCSFWR